MNADKYRWRIWVWRRYSVKNILSLSVFICAYLWLTLLSSCTTKPTDLRTLVPAETLVYLETNDLAAALQPIVDSKPFTEIAKKKPDFSALKGVQMAVAVTGFETTEEKLTDEHSVGRVQPRFVAIAETHAWQFQTVGFAETKLGAFVAEIYGGEPKVEKSEKSDGRYFTWTSADGRKAYALVKGSLIYFGNDESAIDKCLAVRSGQADSIAKTGKVPVVSQETLASGYVSTDGVAQIANIVGLKLASEAGEDPEIQSGIAGILPQLLRKSITDITWTGTKADGGIEDKYQIAMPPETASVFSETMAQSDSVDDSIRDALPAKLDSVTVYKIKNPQVALRSLILAVAEKTDPLVGKLLVQYISETFASYGVKNPEGFLSSLGSGVATVRMGTENDQVAIIASVKDQKLAESSISDKAKPLVTPTANSRGKSWQEDDQVLKVLFENSRVLIGNENVVDLCGISAIHKDPSITPDLFRRNEYSIASVGKEDLASEIAEMLSEKKTDDINAVATYYTETRFTRSGMERRTVSDFGLIGSIIAQLGGDQ
ncbi:hypothetical protein BH10ACI2_BH10ACI2_10200 [soil metagenome]